MAAHLEKEVDNTPTAGTYNAPLASPPAILSEEAGPQHTKWVARRWRLAAQFFARPVPYLTQAWELKMGDLCITIPIAALYLIVNTVGAGYKEVKFTGSPPAFTMMLVFGFVVRNNNLMLKLTGIPFERALLYHKFFALLTIALTMLHAFAYQLDKEKMGAEHESTVRSGMFLFFLFVMLFLSSLNYVRRNYFEVFIRMHWVLFLLVAIVALVHGAYIAWVGFLPWLVDMSYRKYYRAPKYKHGITKGSKDSGVIAADQVSVHKMPGNFVRIQFPRVRADAGESFEYEAGAYAFVCVPSLSKWQWHPFSISSAPHEPFVTFHIKASGDWTKALSALAGKTSPSAPFEILVDGPYGSASVDIEHFKTYSHVVLFSGGIGITPMQSIVNKLHYQYHHEKRLELQQVKFVWSVRDRDTLKAIVDEDFIDTKHMRKQEGAASSYLPDLLLSERHSVNHVFQSEIYLTKGEVDLENPVDQALHRCMRYNTRPDVHGTLRSMGELALNAGKTSVAVMVCGPDPLVADVINQGMTLSESMQVRFDVHTETFNF